MKIAGFNWDKGNMKKLLPKMKTDKDAEDLLSKDLSEYITKDFFNPVTFEFAPKDKSISLRLSKKLLLAIQSASKRRGVSYQKYIREALEQSLKEEVS